MQAGRLPEASKEIASQLQRQDPEPGLELLQCVVQAQQNQTDKAIACLTALVKVRPDMIEAYNNLGVLHASQGKQEEAKRWFTLALQRNPSLWTVHQNLQSLQLDLSRNAYSRALQTELPVKHGPPKLSLLAVTSLNNSSQGITTKAAQAQATNKAPASSVVNQEIAQAPATLAKESPPTAKSGQPAKAVEQTPARAPVSSTAQADGSQDESGQPKTGKADMLDDNTRAQVQAAVQAWAQAWSTQNMPAYLAAYTADYTPGKGISRAAWEAERTARIAGRKFVRVKVNNFNFETTGTKVIARFTQLYESDNIISSHRKRLELVKQEGRWKIVRETVISN